MSDDPSSDWAQPRNHGRPLVIAIVGVSALVTVLLLLPVPDAPRRWVVLGLLAVLFVLQAVLLVRAWRAGRRPLSPRWMRVAHQAGWMWGFFTAFQYAVPIIGHGQSPLFSVLGGAFMGLFFAFILWLADPADLSVRRRPRQTEDSAPAQEHEGRRS